MNETNLQKLRSYCPNIYTVPSIVDSPTTFEIAALNSALDNFPSPEIKLDYRETGSYHSSAKPDIHII